MVFAAIHQCVNLAIAHSLACGLFIDVLDCPLAASNHYGGSPVIFFTHVSTYSNTYLAIYHYRLYEICQELWPGVRPPYTKGIQRYSVRFHRGPRQCSSRILQITCIRLHELYQRYSRNRYAILC